MDARLSGISTIGVRSSKNLSGLSLHIVDARKNIEEVRTIWQALYRVESDGFFLSWTWIEAWLVTLPTEADVKLVKGVRDEQLQLAMLWGINRRKQNFYFRSAHLCALGDMHLDDIVIENNGFVRAKGLELDAHLIDQIMARLKVHVAALTHLKPDFNGELTRLRNIGKHQLRYSEVKSYCVDLEKVSRESPDYLSGLSAGKRRQIRRSTTLYEQRGKLTMRKAGNLEEARDFYGILIDLHQRAWKQRGKPGAFANQYLDTFHRHILEHSFDPETIHLYVFYVGGEALGAIYGFVACGVFRFYQSGFQYEQDNRFKPGLVCHAMLIERLRREGFSAYDFLAGASGYKKSLGNDYYTTATLEITRNHWFSKCLHWASSKLRKGRAVSV